MTQPHDSEQAGQGDDSRRGSGIRDDERLGETHNHIGDTSSREVNAQAASRADTWIGRRLGRYEIRALLGTGGMGMVFKAHDSVIERDVAIKVLPQDLSSDAISLQRFLAEAKGAGKLNHPNAVAIYEIGQEDGLYYLVMEYVAGGSVADQLERGTLSVLDATRIAADACRGLAAAHGVGLVHRDIKPANLLRHTDDSVKVADFGLAKPVLDSKSQLTQTGLVVGTPYFMSPEQCEAKPVDHRSDIYSLGATYYSLLTGANPYEDLGSLVQVMYAHCTADVLDPRKMNPALPVACSEIVARATAKRREDRYQTAAEMLADLNTVATALSGAMPMSQLAIGAPHKINRRRKLLAAGIIGTAVMLGVGGYFGVRNRTTPQDAATPAALASLPAVVPAPTGPPIRVGVLHSLSGTMAESESPVVEATLLAIEEVNQAGGLLGRPVEAVVRDGQSDPQVFAQQARDLILQEKVCTVFGCWTSASRKTVVPIFERHNHLLVYPVQYEGLEESPNVIYLGATPNQQIVPAIEWAFAFQHKRKFFLVGSDYVFPRAANAIIHDVLADLKGEIVGEEYLPLGSFDVKPIVAKIVAAHPDVILNTINGDSNTPFFQELRAQGIAPQQIHTISFSIGEEELRRLNVSQMVGDFAAWNYFESIHSPENQQFIAHFKAKYGPQRVLTDPMEAAYVGVKLWTKAVQQAHSDEVSKIRGAFLGQHILAPEGKLHLESATHHAFKTPRIGKILPNGQFEIVWKAVKPEEPEPFPASRTRQEWNDLLHSLYVNWGEHWSAPIK